MNRKEFLKTCGIACLGMSVLGPFLQSCIKILYIPIEGDSIILPLKEFLIKEDKYRRSVVIYNKNVKYPICVYRLDSDHYIALLMRCTHKGTELQIFGDKLSCPAHGSEFNKLGELTHGPAETDLLTFPTMKIENRLVISLQ